MADNERFKEIAERLAAANQQSEQRKATLEDRREAVRTIIVAEVRAAVAEHEEASRNLIPEAEQQLNDVVKPWWDGVVSSGIFDQVLAWGRARRIRQIRVSDTTTFLAPYGRHMELNHSLQFGGKPFEFTVRELIANSDSQLSPGELLRLSGREDRWGVHFSIGERRTMRTEVIDTGLYAVHNAQYSGNHYGSGAEVLIHPSRPGNVWESVYPVCVIAFAGEIRSGAVWSHLERSTGLRIT